MQWQPIETAPEGVEILICGRGNGGYFVACAKMERGEFWQFEPYEDDFNLLTDLPLGGWMPLPAPPDTQRTDPQDATDHFGDTNKNEVRDA